MKTFIQLCLDNEVDVSEIDDYIDAWHTGSSSLHIYEFLGMTRDEYFKWVENKLSIEDIIKAHT